MDGIKHFLSTPRDINRVINTIRVTYSAVQHEVNVPDFIAIETIRVFYPAVYETIRDNFEKFVGATDYLYETQKQDLLRFHDEWLSKYVIRNKEPLKRLVKRLFPKLESVWGSFSMPSANISYSSNYLPKWRKEARICSPEKFDTFFRFSILQGDLSHQEFKAILSIAGNPELFAKELLTLAKQRRSDGITRIRIFLDRFLDYAEKDIIDYIPTIVAVLFQVGDRLLPEEGNHPFNPFRENESLMRYIISELLVRLGEPARFEIYKTAISNGESLSLISDHLIVLGSEHGKYSEREVNPNPFITLEHLEILENIALLKIRQAAETGELLESDAFRRSLALWKKLASEEEVVTWTNSISQNDVSLMKFVEKFLDITTRHSISDMVSENKYRLHPDWLKPYLDVDQTIKRISGLLETGTLEGNQVIAATQLVFEYNIVQQGKEPEDAIWNRF